MSTSIDEGLFDDSKTVLSFDDPPSLPDLDSATESDGEPEETPAPDHTDKGSEDTEPSEGTGADTPNEDGNPREDAATSGSACAEDGVCADDAENEEGGAAATDETVTDDSDTGRTSGDDETPEQGGSENGHLDHDRNATYDTATDNTGACRDTTDKNDKNDAGSVRSRDGGASATNDTTGDSDETEGLRQGYLPQRALALLPDLLAEPARHIGDRRKRDVFLTGALPMWAGALPNVRFRYGGNEMSPNLYGAVVAPPASGKSALRHARKYGAPLRKELSAGGPAMKTLEDDAPGDGPSGGQTETRQRLFLAADSSAAALKEGLAESAHGVIFETEFRTLSQAYASSCGTFTDVLLKGFQNETIKMSRSTKETVTIPHPAPSIALAGTPATFDGVISGTGDGLFSRFLFYRFDRDFEWNTQFGETGTKLEESLRGAAETFQVAYHRLRAREEPLRVNVPERLQTALDRTFHSLTQKWGNDEDVSRSLQASLTRAGLQAVKIAVVLRGVRLAESGISPASTTSVTLGPADMEAGLRLALTYLLHAVRVETRFQEETSSRTDLTAQKRKYLEALPEDQFSTAEAKRLASQFNVSERNVQRWLKAWRKAGLLIKPKWGMWAKLTPALEGAPGAGGVISVISDIPALAGGRPS